MIYALWLLMFAGCMSLAWCALYWLMGGFETQVFVLIALAKVVSGWIIATGIDEIEKEAKC